MAGFESTLANIPGLGGYLAKSQMNQQQGMAELNQMSGSMGILAKLQAQQEQNELKGLLQQSGGDPGKAIQALVSSGTPHSLELAAKLKGFLPKPAEPYNLPPGGQRRGLNNEILAEAPFRPQADTTTADPLSKVMAARNKLSESNPNHPMLKNYDAYIQKLSTHQAPVNIYSGSLTPAQDAAGNPTFLQPSGREGIPPRQVQGFSPIPSASEKNSSAKNAQAIRGFDSVNKQINSLIAMVDADPTVVGSLGIANRIIEGVQGQIPGQNVKPASQNFSSGLSLLQSSIYRDLVGSGQLSAGDYKHIGEIIRGKGILDSPQSTKDALEGVRAFISSKNNRPISSPGSNLGRPKAEDFFRKSP